MKIIALNNALLTTPANPTDGGDRCLCIGSE